MKDGQGLNMEKHAQEAGEFINRLAEELGHPEEKKRSLIVLRAVLHAIRDRIKISESFDLMSQLPVIIRGIYVEQWKYSDKPPLQYETIEEMKEAVKQIQSRFGEGDFDWGISTEEIITTTMRCLNTYLDQGQLDHIRDQMPKEVKELVMA